MREILKSYITHLYSGYYSPVNTVSGEDILPHMYLQDSVCCYRDTCPSVFIAVIVTMEEREIAWMSVLCGAAEEHNGNMAL